MKLVIKGIYNVAEKDSPPQILQLRRVKTRTNGSIVFVFGDSDQPGAKEVFVEDLAVINFTEAEHTLSEDCPEREDPTPEDAPLKSFILESLESVNKIYSNLNRAERLETALGLVADCKIVDCQFCESNAIYVSPSFTFSVDSPTGARVQKARYAVTCSNCEAKGSTRDKKEDAIASWNMIMTAAADQLNVVDSPEAGESLVEIKSAIEDGLSELTQKLDTLLSRVCYMELPQPEETT